MEYDVSIIRPLVRNEDIELRRQEASPSKLKRAKKALLKLHTFELMATNIYKFQTKRESSELNRQVIAAMLNELSHYADFQLKLYEFGWKPSKLRWAFWIVGFVFGYFSRLLGKKATLKTGIWVENRAVHEYEELLNRVEWDEKTRRVIEKNQADEYGHMERWKKLLSLLNV